MTQPAPKGDDVAHNAPKSDDEKPSSRAVKLDRLARSLFDPSMCNHIDRKGDDSPNSPDNAANPDGAENRAAKKATKKAPRCRRIAASIYLGGFAFYSLALVVFAYS